MRSPRSHTSRRDLRVLLHAASVRPVVDVRPGFVSGLGAHLVARIPSARLVALPRRERRRRAPVLAGAVAATAAVVLVGALTGVSGPGLEDRALALAVAVDTTVRLPDGRMIEGARGVSLPDGTVVRTGPNGRCSAGDVDFGPGIEALVDAGRLRLRQYPGGAAIADAPADASPNVGAAPHGSTVGSGSRPGQ
jgi:hypothetical protein